MLKTCYLYSDWRFIKVYITMTTGFFLSCDVSARMQQTLDLLSTSFWHVTSRVKLD